MYPRAPRGPALAASAFAASKNSFMLAAGRAAPDLDPRCAAAAAITAGAAAATTAGARTAEREAAEAVGRAEAAVDWGGVSRFPPLDPRFEAGAWPVLLCPP